MLRIRNVPIVLISLFLLYIFLNLELLFWEFFNPEGFWGIVWFYFFSFMLLTSFFIIWDLIDVVVMMRKIEKTSYRNIILVAFFLLFSTGFYYGGAIALPWIFYNRYKYIERSERFFDKGKYETALNYSEKVLKKTSLEKKQPSKFWLLPTIYNKSSKGIERRNFRYYQAAINHAFCLKETGNHNNEADELYKKLTIFSKEKFPSKSEYIIIPLMGRAMIYIGEGRNVEAEECFNELSKLVNEIDKSDIDNMVQTLLFYSIYAQKNGDFNRSQSLRKQAQELYLNSGKSLESTNYLTLVVGVATDLITMSKYEEASKILKENKRIARKKKDNLIYQEYLKANAQITDFEGDYQESEKLLKDILKIIKKNQGPNHIDYAKSLYDLAFFYFRNAKYADAKTTFTDALAQASKHISANKLVYYKILLGKVMNDYSNGDFTGIETSLAEIEKFLYNQINDNFLFLAEDEKEIYILSLSIQVDLINSIYVGLNKPTLYEHVYNNILSTKSIALQSNQYLRQLILKSGKKELVDLFNSIKNGKEELLNFDLSNPNTLNRYNTLAQSILNQEKELLKTISSSPDYRKFDVRAVEWQNVKSSLKSDEVAVEYLNLPIIPELSSQRVYYALIIRPSFNEPKLVKLFNEEDVVALLNKDGNTKDRVSAIYTDANIKNLYDLLWSPVEEHLSGANKVYVSLSGILHQISFPAILADKNKEIIFVGSTRAVADNDRIERLDNKVLSVMYGNIDYDNIDSPPDTSEKDLQRSPINEFQDLIYRNGYQRLPNTKYEIEEISKILADKDFPTKVYTGKNATEESFKGLSNTTPGLIHLATHGYYYPIEKNIPVRRLSIGINYGSVIQNPLFRSGLLLAGANQLNKPIGLSDGILTAFEISKIDLHNVDLVVLSACETGLGDLNGSEGVFGLQRAFKLAGVKSIIMSLWKVPDEQTSELMQLFYKYYVSGNTKQKSLFMAQRQLCLKYKDPFYWAAFSLVE